METRLYFHVYLGSHFKNAKDSIYGTKRRPSQLGDGLVEFKPVPIPRSCKSTGKKFIISITFYIDTFTFICRLGVIEID